VAVVDKRTVSEEVSGFRDLISLFRRPFPFDLRGSGRPWIEFLAMSSDSPLDPAKRMSRETLGVVDRSNPQAGGKNGLGVGFRLVCTAFLAKPPGHCLSSHRGSAKAEQIGIEPATVGRAGLPHRGPATATFLDGKSDSPIFQRSTEPTAEEGNAQVLMTRALIVDGSTAMLPNIAPTFSRPGPGLRPSLPPISPEVGPSLVIFYRRSRPGSGAAVFSEGRRVGRPRILSLPRVTTTPGPLPQTRAEKSDPGSRQGGRGKAGDRERAFGPLTRSIVEGDRTVDTQILL
jgi:hypothetical protein